MRLVLGYIHHFASTTVHKFWVARNLIAFDWLDPELWRRALLHDLSKYRWDEAGAFASTIHRLKTTTYGTDAYRSLLREIKPAIDLHYRRNRHHPEHHKNGINGMNRADLIEMVADWGAAVRRHADGDLDRSILTNAKRFGYSRDMEIGLRAVASHMGLL